MEPRMIGVFVSRSFLCIWNHQKWYLWARPFRMIRLKPRMEPRMEHSRSACFFTLDSFLDPPKHAKKETSFDFRMIRLKPRTEPRMDTHQFSGFRRPTPKPRTEPGMKLSLELQASPGCKPLHSRMRNKAETLGWLGGNLGRNLGWQVELFGAFLSQSGSVTGLAKNVKIPVLGTHFILKRRMKRFFHPSGKFHPNF